MGASEAGPLARLEGAQQKMRKERKETQQARAYAVGLKALQFSNELVTQMEQHAKVMEEKYQQSRP